MGGLRTFKAVKTYQSCLVLFSMLFLLISNSQTASASIVVDTTRVIYPLNNKEVAVRLTNKGEAPKLVQAWIDDGDEKSSPEKIDVPFLVLTPIFRMEPSKGQVLRIRYTNSKAMPSDRESIFWLNVLEIPPKPGVGVAEENYLQFSFRTRIKLFLRPSNLKGTAAKAADQITWKYQPGSLQLTNLHPITFLSRKFR
jgi:chaperone protein EcpD